MSRASRVPARVRVFRIDAVRRRVGFRERETIYVVDVRIEGGTKQEAVPRTWHLQGELGSYSSREAAVAAIERLNAGHAFRIEP